MDFTKSTSIVYNRIQIVEPENVSKIIGYLLLQDHGEREMIRLAFSPDNTILALINKAKTELGLSKLAVSATLSPSWMNKPAIPDLQIQFPSFSPASSCQISSPTILRTGNTYWDSHISAFQQLRHNVEYATSTYADTSSDDYRLQTQMQFLSLDNPLESMNSVGSDYTDTYHYTEHGFGVRDCQRPPSLPEFPVKVCYYFSKGFCKHGNNCRYIHGMPSNLCRTLTSNSNVLASEEQVFSLGSLEKLERELTELLKASRGFPVSIASLPMLYYEKYGKTLQAEGYLTESQRQGKAGYNLTKLLARLKNSIRLIDRPHGQHSVILAEDLPKYMEYINERNEPSGLVVGSRQIYLTFPADSTFTEQDVSNYFNKFGPVQDVRIPCQQKRMFGFVTFVYPDTVKQILAKENPHFVSGARVLAKPYREKSLLVDRNHTERNQHHLYCSTKFVDGDFELPSMPRVCDNSILQRKQFLQEHETALGHERWHLADFKLNSKPSLQYPYFGFSLNELNFSEERGEHMGFPSDERFNYLLNVLNTASTSDRKIRQVKTENSEQESQGINPPDSPFASAIGNGISTVI